MPNDSHDSSSSAGKRLIRRHSATVRLTHWVNVVCLAVLLMSGLQIFNAHPALYWGSASHFETPLVAMTGRQGENGAPAGVTTAFGVSFDTTGLLGVSGGQQRGFPAWATLPSYQDLATGRRWHFLFAWLLVANGLIYLVYSLLSGHVWRDVTPSRREMGHIGRSVLDHLRLRFPRGKEATHYNVLQKLSYLTVVFVLLPVLIAAGLTMSPGMDAAFPWLLDLFGGRQSARTVHFAAAWLLVLFAAVHVAMVLVSGVWNNMRSMITGRYAIESREGARGR